MKTLIAKRAWLRACGKWFAAISCQQPRQLDDIGLPRSKIGSFQGSGHFSNAHGRSNSPVIDRREANRLPQLAYTMRGFRVKRLAYNGSWQTNRNLGIYRDSRCHCERSTSTTNRFFAHYVANYETFDTFIFR